MTVNSLGETATTRRLLPVFLGLLLATLAACGDSGDEPAENSQGFTAPSAHTSAGNQKLGKGLPRDDGSDMEAAMRGFIATREASQAQISNAQGDVIWDLEDYDFVQGEAPDSANPSLWRLTRCCMALGRVPTAQNCLQSRLGRSLCLPRASDALFGGRPTALEGSEAGSGRQPRL